MQISFSTGLSGLNAASTGINVIGNDLANLNTTGYKASELGFADLMSQHLGGSAANSDLGLGVGQATASRVYTQGAIQATGGSTNGAIQGNGFFMTKDSQGSTFYTRDGSFTVSAAGQLENAAGHPVQGWSASANGVVNTNGPTGNLSVPIGATVGGTPTSTMSMSLNLNATPSGTSTPASFSTPVQAVDSLGAIHTLTAKFTNTAVNTWTYSVTIPTAEVSTAGAATVGTGTLVFNASGQLSSPAATAVPSLEVKGLVNGATDMAIAWNLYDPATAASNITQFTQTSAVSKIVQNGFPAGNISSVSLQDGGLLMASYSNGQQLTVGKLAVATVNNPTSLHAVGGNELAATALTGTPVVGQSGTGSAGTVLAGSLEKSTVDIAAAFTSLLTFQRSYQANSRAITTDDQILQETIQLIHA